MTVDIAMLSEAEKRALCDAKFYVFEAAYCIRPNTEHRIYRRLTDKGLLHRTRKGVLRKAGREARALLLKDNSDAG
jgi:hypothetical protein